MHYYAQKEAMKAGPRVFEVLGGKRIGYGLTKEELKRLFLKHGYNISTGSRWRTAIQEWRDPHTYGDVISTEDRILLNKKENTDWCVVFTLLSKTDQDRLLRCAADAGLLALPRELRGAWDVCAV